MFVFHTRSIRCENNFVRVTRGLCVCLLFCEIKFEHHNISSCCYREFIKWNFLINNLFVLQLLHRRRAVFKQKANESKEFQLRIFVYLIFESFFLKFNLIHIKLASIPFKIQISFLFIPFTRIHKRLSSSWEIILFLKEFNFPRNFLISHILRWMRNLRRLKGQFECTCETFEDDGN